MELIKKKLKRELLEIIDTDGDIRKFFKPTSDIDELAVKCVLWGHYFLPKYFSKPTPAFHYELIKTFFRKGNDYNAYPRGFGKTSCIQLCILFACVNGLDEFIVLLEKTATEADEVLEVIREEAQTNDEILRVYGDLTKINPKGHQQANIRDSLGDFFVNGIRLRGKGFDTLTRGFKSRHSRPTRIVLDDVESDEHIDNIEQRKKYLNSYIRAVIPSIDIDTGVIKMFGTILHDDSLLNTLVKNHNGKIYAAWDEKHKLLWASNWTVEKLEQKREEMRISEKGDAGFYQEYFNQPLPEGDQLFRKEMFQYFKNLDLPELQKKPHRIYTMVDPAISKKTTADFTAIVTVMVDELNRIFVLEITRDRLNPLETIKAIFAHYERWNPIYVAVEAISYQQALKFLIDEEKIKESSTVRTMQVVEVKSTSDKFGRIKRLQPKYALLNVFHNSDDANTQILEEELKRFTVAVHDDVCFVAGTKILTDNGQKNIEDIKVGDMVMTRQGFMPVSFLSKRKKEVVTNIGLTGTPNHPVFVEKNGVDIIKDLKSVRSSDTLHIWNEKLSSMEEKSIIAKSVAINGKQEVYNLQVTGCPEYFANGILVHNCDALSYVMEIIVPVSKTVDRNYRKYLDIRQSGAQVSY